MLHNFNLDESDSLYPRHAGGRPPTFTPAQRREIKKLALSRPVDHDLAFSTWSLAKLATSKQSSDPDFEAKKNRILSTCDPTPGPAADDSWWRWLVPRRRRRATYTRPHGCATCWPPYDLSRDRLYGRIKPRKRRGAFLVFLRCLRTLYPPGVRLGIVLDNFSPHLPTKDDARVGDWSAANNVEQACTPTNASWPNRIEAQFQALRYFTLDGTDSSGHAEQATMIRRYIAWRNRMPTTTGSARSSTGQGCLMRH